MSMFDLDLCRRCGAPVAHAADYCDDYPNCKPLGRISCQGQCAAAAPLSAPETVREVAKKAGVTLAQHPVRKNYPDAAPTDNSHWCRPRNRQIPYAQAACSVCPSTAGADEASSPSPTPQLCPSCRAADNNPYIDANGARMRACGRCMIQWRDLTQTNLSPAALTQGEWVKVTPSSMPDEGREVEIIDIDNKRFITKRRGDFFEMNLNRVTHCWHIEDTKYWRELPSPPEENRDE